MLSELLMIIMLMTLMSQSSALWSSLITIPLSIVIIMTSSSTNIYSGVYIFMFVMIFIGGLLVLLLSVASISFQEQSYNFMKMWMFAVLLICTPFLLSSKLLMIDLHSMLLVISWLENQNSLYMIMILILLVSLFVMSKLILSFKGLIRSM